MRFRPRILRLRAQHRLLRDHALSRAHTREGVSSCQTTVAIVPDGAQWCEDELAWDDRGRLPRGLPRHRTCPHLTRHPLRPWRRYSWELQGSPDPDIASMCWREGRVLVTLDLDFVNIREYPPENYAGLIVLRVANQSRPHVLGVISQIFAVLSEQPIAGHLWIVSESSVRIRSGTSADDSP